MSQPSPTYLRPLDAASDYLARAWSVLPVGADKRPFEGWAELQKRRASDAEVDQWRAKWPDAGIGILTGALSGLLVVDLDAKDAESFARAKERVTECLPESLVCPIARTRNGGEHWYFRRPESGCGNRARVDGLPLDVRCDGGYVVAPPTSGYSWVISPDECEPPEVPAALLVLLAKPRPAAAVPIDQRNRAPGFDWAVERARRYVARLPIAVQGEHGSNPCFRAACVLVHEFALADCDAFDVLCEYSQRCIPPWSEKELWHKIAEAHKNTRHDRPFGYLRDSRPTPTDEPSGEYEIDGGAPSDPRPLGKPTIRLGVDQARVVREAILALGRQHRYYSRGTSLYRILQPSAPEGEPRPLARLELVPVDALQIAMSDAANWEKAKKVKEGEEWTEATPPSWAVSGVHAAGQWHGLAPLVGVVSTPCLRRDGSVLAEPGYDTTTGLVYRPVGRINPIKDRPTLGDALAARDELLEVVKDFPFAGEEYKAAWLSLVLTPFARHALQDSAPLGYIDANTRGSGKSLLASATGYITTGRLVPMTSWPEDEAEREKRITALMMEGASMVVFDNCESLIGGQALNIILTSASWSGRILGQSKSTGELPLRTTFLATGNNCDFSRDTPRRTIHVRLVSPLERPEQRVDFEHKYLLEWVGENRPRLAAAALTILRAYVVAGRPITTLKAMGGYTDWSRAVREAVVWVGMGDPVETQDALMATSDRSTSELADIMNGIISAQTGTSDYHTAQQLLVLATLPGGEELRDALLEHAPGRKGELPTARIMGMLLRRHVDRVHGGNVIRRSTGVHTRWRVVPST